MDKAATQVRYAWGATHRLARNFPRTAESAAAAAEELRRIQGNEPSVKPADVVKASMPAAAPLHNAFDWSNRVAAEKWRLEQARTIISQVRVIRYSVREDPHQLGPSPLFVSFKPAPDEPRSYRPMAQTMASPEGRSAVLVQAVRDLQIWRRRYRCLHQLAEVFAALDGIELLEPANPLEVEGPYDDGPDQGDEAETGEVLDEGDEPSA